MLPSIRTAARRAARTHQPLARAYAPSITYSGGQASEGQGGFYGSGGAIRGCVVSSARRAAVRIEGSIFLLICSGGQMRAFLPRFRW